METFLLQSHYKIKLIVSTLPIRNGNKIFLFIHSPYWESDSEYLTYKEWKLFPPIVEIQKNKNVSTLPIRNGNFFFIHFLLIENLIVSTLPIRNGNFNHLPLSVNYDVRIMSTLPIRNGNAIIFSYYGGIACMFVSTLP